jgi:outer membrane protein TolC
MDDKRETMLSVIEGNETKFTQAEVGVSQVTRFGLAGKLYYGISNTEMVGGDPNYITLPKYTDSSLTLEVSQPLWQNSGGSQYKNSERAGSSQAKSSMFAKRYEAQMILMNAETKFWKLSAARESIAIITETLERTKAIHEYIRGKVNRRLADTGDLLQAEAMVQARNLDLVRARSEEKQAAREFNAMRTVDSDVVEEEVKLPSLDEVLRMLSVEPTRAQARNDVRAAEMGAQALAAAGDISSDKTRPDVSVFALTSLNKRGANSSDAVADTINDDNPYYVAGLKLSIPLGSNTTASVRAGYSKEAEGAKLAYLQKKHDQDMEWKTLVTGMQDTREALLAADTLQKAQLAKLENERARQKDGRSTMFQVFSFDQEYLASRLNMVSLRVNALALIAQAKTFQDITSGIPDRGAL